MTMQGEIRPGYKQTELGVIPEDWEATTLGDLVTYTNGTAHEQNITEFGKFIVVNSKFISTEGMVRKYSKFCNCATSKGDLLMVMSDVPNGRAIAKCYLVESNDTYTVNQRICVLAPSGVNGTFLFYKLNRNPFYLAFDDGAKQTNLRKSEVLSCPLSVPKSKEEQRAIAAALSDAEALIAALEAMIAKKRDLKQAAMQHLLTGKTRLPGFSGEWEVKRLGECASFFKGKGLPKSALSASGKFPCIHYGELFTFYGVTIADVASRTDQSDGAFLSVQNDVLMPTSDVTPRGLAKSSCLLADNVILGGDTLVIRPNEMKLDGSFLAAQIRFRDEQVLKLVTGSTVFHLYSSDMRKFMLPVPALAEQTAIAEVLSDMDADLAAIEAQAAKARAVKQGMMQELLTGKVRLV